MQSVGGELTVPGDKSISHRSLLLAGIAEGRTRISGFLASEDCNATLHAMRALGVSIEQPEAATLEIEGVGLHGLRAATQPLDLGNSGTAMRLLAGLLAAQRFDSTLIGDASLMKRPMERVAVPLRAMGAVIKTHAGRPPLEIRGGHTLHAVHYVSPVASAQVKSAVLLAGLYAQGMTSVMEPAVTRDHTERMLRTFGATVQAEGRRVRLAGPAKLHGAALDVPGDFSSAAFFVVAACLAARGVVTIRNVGVNPTRTGLLQLLRRMGGEIRVVNPRLSGEEPVADLEIEQRELRGIEVPRDLVPLAIDEFPAFFVAAACAHGETVVTGAEELRVKESDRIAVMADGLKNVGVGTEVLADGLRVQGGALSGGRIDSHGDHRIAMAFAIASVRAAGPIEIHDVANVATSFPGFAELANHVGFDIDSVAT
ncbi:MAG TPA: 3-phosphoshikimate 1-carboxyvinyltransferase [Steroidobacteraceae bacterium]|nr:3-phosphoshikimate 1-carboxyvinyltransferase [Steroidobacteraceae bacterium]